MYFAKQAWLWAYKGRVLASPSPRTALARVHTDSDQKHFYQGKLLKLSGYRHIRTIIPVFCLIGLNIKPVGGLQTG